MRFIVKAAALAAVIAAGCALGGCSTTDASTAASQTVDTICSSEPALYAAYVTIATAKHASAKKLATEAAAHQTIANVCANPPTDIASAASDIATAYATIVTARASVAKQGA